MLIDKIFRKAAFLLQPYLIPEDICKLLPYFNQDSNPVIWDVGANVGQSSLEYVRWVRNCRIRAFEPFPTTFNELRKNVNSFDAIQCYQFALGESAYTMEVHEQGSSSMNRIDSVLEKEKKNSQLVKIQVRTIDEQLREVNDSHIDLLKIDTEGHEIAVLNGSRDALKANTIRFIDIEVGMNSKNTYHTPLEKVKSLLESFDYHMYHIHEQTHEWTENKPRMRRANVIFVSPEIKLL